MCDHAITNSIGRRQLLRVRPIVRFVGCHCPIVFVALASWLSGGNASCLLAAKPAAVDFDRDVRIILSDKCFLCHGPADDTREAELRLDTRVEAISMGAIVPGSAEASEMIARITSSDPDARMPPPESGKSLTEDEIEHLRAWIDDGARYAEHWAFVTPTRRDPPLEIDGRNAIDHFVRARLQQSPLQPAEAADPTTLVRRLYLDLIGLPPSPQQVDEYVNRADRESAYRDLVEQLLRSPNFGEHWARWWLDAARYADSDGYEKDKQRSVWFYRDWVINALNNDLPYDQFIIQQIAGDLLPNAGQNELVATGFLRNSMVNEEGGADPEQFRIEGMFDRIDAIGKAILGITTQCAQCHTHKYDPISHHEYYQLFAALNDRHEATISAYTPEQASKRRHLTTAITKIEDDLKRRHPDWKSEFEAWVERAAEESVSWRTVTPTDLPFEGQKFRVLDDGSILSESYAPTKTSNTFSLPIEPCKITAFRLDVLRHPQLPRGGPGRSIYGTGALTEFEVTITSVADSSTTQTVKFTRAVADVNPPTATLLPPYRDRDPDKDERVTGPIAFAIDGDHKTAWTTDDGPAHRNEDHCAVFYPAEPIEVREPSTLALTLHQLHGGWNSDDNQNHLFGRYRFSITDATPLPTLAAPQGIEKLIALGSATRDGSSEAQLFRYWRTTIEAFHDDNLAIRELEQQFPETDSQLVVQAMAKPRPTHRFERGDFLSSAEPVSPGVPAFLNPMPMGDEPARLRLARWLVADDAPTTARVIVNRIWQSYFGQALVATPEDFGFQSAAPTHPELLDWLAVELMDNGWSLKHIHRLIVDSSTYQQSSLVSQLHLQVDPGNQHLARGPRIRVNAETVRDVVLAASGLLDRRIGGPSIFPPAPDFLFEPPASYGPKIWNPSTDRSQYRRSLYVHSYRSVPYPTMQVFDAPKGDSACVRRQRSNTPLQALVMLNEPQFVACARAMATRVLNEAKASDESRMEYAFRLCVSRRPTPDERTIVARLLQQQRDRFEKQELDIESLIGTSATMYEQLTNRQANEFAPWIVVCRAVLNLDETITKN